MLFFFKNQYQPSFECTEQQLFYFILDSVFGVLQVIKHTQKIFTAPITILFKNL